MAGHPPLREGGGPGPQLPGRLHQPRQCAQGGQDIRQVPAVIEQEQKGRIPRFFAPPLPPQLAGTSKQKDERLRERVGIVFESGDEGGGEERGREGRSHEDERKGPKQSLDNFVTGLRNCCLLKSSKVAVLVGTGTFQNMYIVF
jgi:hypothetical protein